ncbi:ribosomal protein S18 acetylase RimI-like enzyme [Pseudomonas protegens]|uniref:GNAT family N-acetyltransferase n=1 Tax=Pseudomonas TaxID=286 RepID=UPI000F499C96|nr:MULTISPECIES: GNAT family N-acetyltransferase [Pseudomonas]MCS4259707.1 ribosomal protein S18 acetylase RimI-like enzyme [Pseudomonas sp. BIGb0176]ROQ56864.1 ribosomal protein S18 acetylase RimI-like enzyme [Pseudomonas protegens]ROQ85035.1 ribosomal protein S18 acetylase RimI-like enzyme [Pseudomonas protegens]
MPLCLRNAQQDDTQRLSQIARQTFALACPPDTPATEIEAFIQENLLPEHFSALLEAPGKQLRGLLDDNRIIGYSLVNLHPQDLGVASADGIAELTRCYLDAAHHGSGAAQFLLAQTLAQQPGPLRLTVNEHNARAIRFYQRNGFVRVGETLFPCGADLHRDWVMLRR